MEMLLTNMDWRAIIVSAVVAFFIGWFWYSERGFGKKWAEGVGVTLGEKSSSMMWGMLSQIGSTLLLAWVIAFSITNDLQPFLVLIVLTIAGFLKASGFYAKKSKTAITIEVSYILVMTVVMYLMQQAL